MGYRVKGTLKLPDGTPANNAEIEFISRKNFSPLVQELKSNIRCSATGAYDVTLEYGEYAVIVYPGGTYPAALGTIILATDTVTGQDLPTLLQQAEWQPATPEYIQQISQWLAEANSSATSSAVSASAAKVSETNAKASESAAQNLVSQHATKAGAHPISGVIGLQGALDSKYSASNKPTAADVGAVNKAGDMMTGNLIMRGSQQHIRFQHTSHNGGDLIWERDNAGVIEQQARLWSSSPTKLHLGAGSETSEGGYGVMTIHASNDVFIGVNRVYTAANKPTAADIQNVVSPVSSGGIIERGSNANGEYVKFADGTMICTGLGLQGVFASVGTIYAVATYAAAFVEINSVVTQVGFTDLGYNLPLTFSGPTAYNVTSKTGNLVSTNIGIISNSVFTQGNADITRFGYTATGRWK